MQRVRSSSARLEALALARPLVLQPAACQQTQRARRSCMFRATGLGRALKLACMLTAVALILLWGIQLLAWQRGAEVGAAALVQAIVIL